jgi:hypothetical protein
MQAIKAPKTIKIYQLIKQSGMYFNLAGASSGTHSLGMGFYATQHEAEINRTMETLKLTDTDKGKFHVFEIEVPNPAYEEE